MRNCPPTYCTYCGLQIDMSAYTNMADYASAVWDMVFQSRDGVDSTENATRWANESAARARADWAEHNN